ncbi:MAG: sensor histidine kinase [Proteobacteria bacterium]|nr:sensor histidine kinase [Desulfobulbaceae bacterium]MBU4152262.1 sensor histidine kinase [Pseudomonadota bacterium]
MLDTLYAPAEKATPQVLLADIDIISNHAIVDTLLRSTGGLLAILNEQRQILSINDSFLKMLGLADQKDVLFLRPGEAVSCIHAHESPHGCGTTKYCATCGAAIAIVTALAENTPTERICPLTAKRGEKTVELSFAVRAQPIHLEERRYLLLFLQDITKEQFLSSMERTFFHDINNIICGLLGRCELYSIQHNNPPELQQITNLVLRISQEIAIQRTLSRFGEAGLKAIKQLISSEDILTEITSVFDNHPAAQHRTITTSNNAPEKKIITDITLMLRVVCNMITNALEATEERGEIRVWIDNTPEGLAIKVWNKSAIPEPLKLRIFQRHFSTKKGAGRGLGTYSMKIFGEEYLSGKVSFTSTPVEGTTFCITL